jgi:hypothetical protein
MRAVDLGLGVLAVATAGLAYLALQHVEVLPGPGSSDGESVGATATGVAPDDAAVTSQAPGDQTELTATSAPVDLGTLRTALAVEDVQVLVLGDSTSNSRAEWVELWAEGLGEDRAVTIAHWDEADDEGYTDAVTLTEGGEPATVWSGSVTGLSAADAADRLEALVPQAPDLVLLSFGRDDQADEVASGLEELVDELRAVAPDAPVGVVVQPGGDEETTEAVREWAGSADVAVLDVDAAWAEQTPDVGVDDAEGNPTAEAADLWAQRVSEALAP